MQFSTPESIVTFLLERTEAHLEEDYDRYMSSIHGQTTQKYKLHASEEILTLQERELLQKNLPREIMYPFEPIRGNPSPISAMSLMTYLDSVSKRFANYILNIRYSPKPYDSVTLTLYIRRDPKTSKPYMIDPQTPSPTLVYVGLIDGIFFHYGSVSMSTLSGREDFNSRADSFLSSPKTLDNISSQRGMYSHYVTVIFATEVAEPYRYVSDVVTLAKISSILYDPKNAQYNGWGPEFDRFGVNWRTLPGIGAFQPTPGSRKASDDKEILNFLRQQLSQFYESEYKYGGPQYREKFDEWERKQGRLSVACDANNYEMLEQYVRELLPELTLEEICEIVNKYEEILEDYQPPCQGYAREDLLIVVDGLLQYLPKRDLCEILRIYGSRHGRAYAV